MKVESTFLGTGRTFEIELPPELSSDDGRMTAWKYQGNRSIVYVSAASFSPFEAPDFRPLVDLQKDDVKVAIVERDAPPTLLVAVWQLSDYYLQTFVDGEIADLDSMLRVVEAISITHGPNGPTVSYQAPLAPADDPDLYMRDNVTFGPANDASTSLLEVLDIGTSAKPSGGESQAYGYFTAWRRVGEGLILRLTGDPAEGSKVAGWADQAAESVRVTG